jgi:hypothetical protein
VRGNKLMAWRMTPVMTSAGNGSLTSPEGSRVAAAQKRLFTVTREAMRAAAEDARQGLMETVGVNSRLIEGERCGIAIELPPGTDLEMIARAIDLENIESWLGEDGQVQVAIGPWYSTKDVDQVVLTTTKVIHVMLGLHAVCSLPQAETLSLVQRVMRSAVDVLVLLKPSER